ncbi:MAG TPA: glycosyltransferase family 2 protein [Actinomycetota bacterium]
MLALRIVGGIFAAALLVVAVLRYRRRNISRLNLLITWVLGVALVLLAIAPVAYQPLFDAFNFGTKGSGLRLIAVGLFGLLVVLALQVRTMSYTDQNERAIRLLVEALAVQTFEEERARLGDRLPAGECIVAVSPAYNEAENVAAVIRSIPETIEGYPVVPIVVDDASGDGTAEVAREAGAIVVRNPIRRGGGLALRVGYEVAAMLNAVVVVSLDADGQHVPEEMPVLVKPVLAGDADMVNGSRLLGEFERESVIRHIGVHFFSRMVTVMTGQRITDPSSGYRATRAEILKNFVLKQDQFWTSELLIEALRHRSTIIEVPITIRARAGGKSKKPKSLKYGWNFSKAIIQTWLR